MPPRRLHGVRRAAARACRTARPSWRASARGAPPRRGRAVAGAAAARRRHPRAGRTARRARRRPRPRAAAAARRAAPAGADRGPAGAAAVARRTSRAGRAASSGSASRKSFNPRNPQAPPRPGVQAARIRRGRTRRRAPAGPPRGRRRRSRGCARDPRRIPCHGCAEREEHARWAERYHRLERETEQLRRRVEGRSQIIARTFDRVCAVLEQLGYLDGDAVTERGAASAASTTSSTC